MHVEDWLLHMRRCRQLAGPYRIHGSDTDIRCRGNAEAWYDQQGCKARRHRYLQIQGGTVMAFDVRTAFSRPSMAALYQDQIAAEMLRDAQRMRAIIDDDALGPQPGAYARWNRSSMQETRPDEWDAVFEFIDRAGVATAAEIVEGAGIRIGVVRNILGEMRARGLIATDDASKNGAGQSIWALKGKMFEISGDFRILSVKAARYIGDMDE